MLVCVWVCVLLTVIDHYGCQKTYKNENEAVAAYYWLIYW